MELTTILDALKEKHGDAIGETTAFRGQDCIVIDAGAIQDVCQTLATDDEMAFDMLTDLTAVDNMGQAPRFTIVYNLYSIKNNRRLRLKIGVDESDTPSTVETVWKAANWLEREVFDLFGITFAGHSDLRRILLWDGYDGHPLRKDFPLTGKPQAMTYR